MFCIYHTEVRYCGNRCIGDYRLLLSKVLLLQHYYSAAYHDGGLQGRYTAVALLDEPKSAGRFAAQSNGFVGLLDKAMSW